MIRKWLPQTDILSHPNVVLFISQGGMFSTYEALRYGIQNLAIPFASDHFRNAMFIEDKGIGKWLDFRNITTRLLRDTLSEMVDNDKYTRHARELAEIFGDNLIHPMDEFIWWVDHVIKFNGAKYLRSQAAIDMSTFTYLMLDVILVNLFICLIIFIIFYYMIKNLTKPLLSKLCCAKIKATQPSAARSKNKKKQ